MGPQGLLHQGSALHGALRSVASHDILCLLRTVEYEFDVTDLAQLRSVCLKKKHEEKLYNPHLLIGERWSKRAMN